MTFFHITKYVNLPIFDKLQVIIFVKLFQDDLKNEKPLEILFETSHALNILDSTLSLIVPKMYSLKTNFHKITRLELKALKS